MKEKTQGTVPCVKPQNKFGRQGNLPPEEQKYLALAG